MIDQSDPSHQANMILNLGCLALELQMKWNIKPFWKRQSKDKSKCSADVGDNSSDGGYYYISYNNITEQESLGDWSGPEDLHYACSSPSSSCNHGDDRELSFHTFHSGSSSGYEEVQVEDERRQREQFWSLQSELLLVECC